MPFVSKAQRRYMWSRHPEIARRWTEEYGSGGKNLPEHKKAKKYPRLRRKHAHA